MTISGIGTTTRGSSGVGEIDPYRVFKKQLQYQKKWVRGA